MKGTRFERILIAVAAGYAAAIAISGTTSMVRADGGTGFRLTGLKPTDPPDLATYVSNRQAAIALGKALFWDTQSGSDGVQACASCHFSAGADPRSKNQLNPGANGVFDHTFTGQAQPNYQLTIADFPSHRFSDPNNRLSQVTFDTDDIRGSQGVTLRSFISVGALAQDGCTDEADSVWSVNGVDTRRATGKNAPSVIGAAFNFRNFWNGRAREQFNGVNPAGATDPSARVYQTGADGHVVPVAILIANSSAASQSTGPILSGTEMSCDGRNLPKVGRKLLGLMPLASQHIDPADSVLGSLRDPVSGKGLTVSYGALINQAFQPQWWNSQDSITIAGESFSQVEANFSLFWGLAIQLYEDTLIPDQTPLDQYLGGNRTALTADQVAGMNVFTGKGRCNQCHDGPLFTRATTNDDRGFTNTGVRPTAEDTGDVVRGGGRFKTTGLRNIELTGPYFHDGGQVTLRQVVDFYNRGGDFHDLNVDGNVRPLGLTDTEKTQLVSFMLALTDERVRYRRAPFDGPELCVPNGAGSTLDSTGKYPDIVYCLPAAGAGGAATPLSRFLGANPFAQ